MISILEIALKASLPLLAVFLILVLIGCYRSKKRAVLAAQQPLDTKNFLLNCLFVKLPQKLDLFVRRIDFWFSKSYGHKLWRLIFIKGYPKVALILIFLTVFFLIGGLAPTWSKVPLALVATLLVIMLISYLTNMLQDNVPGESSNPVLKYLRVHALHFVSSMVILIINAVIWFLLATPLAAAFFYKHIHIPIITVLVLLSFVALFLRVYIVRRPKSSNTTDEFKAFSKKLNNTQLIWESGEPGVSWATALYGLISGPTYHVLKLLLLPSLIIVMLPTEMMQADVFVLLLGFSWLLLAMCTVHRRLHFLLTVTKRWFLTGGQLIVSFIMIVLAIGRIFDISYVSTLLDSVPVFHMVFFILSAYSSLWLYEYWSNSLLCRHLLDYLRADGVPDCHHISRIPYDYKNTGANSPEHSIQLYSGARFAVVAETPDEKGELKSIYEKRAIFESISEQDNSLSVLYSDLSKRIMLYFTLQNVILIVCAILTIVWIVAHDAEPMLNAKRITSSVLKQADLATIQKVDLKKIVLDREAGDDKHVIFLASSGGGTRAAIYTTSLLAALKEMELLDNVVLASGVSGGGMSLAYFSANRDQLLKTSPTNCEANDGQPVNNIWCQYINVVSDNHIMKVASRIGEAKIFTGTSLGQFLADSFEQSFYIKLKDDKYKHVHLDQLTRMGLILNTSLIAHPFSESQSLSSAIGEYEKKENNDGLYKIDTGGRLIFTNIQDLKHFPWNDSTNLFADSNDVRFKYVVGGGEGLPLHTVGALTANFPPVFPNAIVKLDDKRFSISDGGAVENRGMISLMYAVRSFIEKLSKDELETLPTMHIVMAEGSAVSVDYKNYESGLIAIGNASLMIGNQLILELKSMLKAKCGKPCETKLQFHYLNMPLLMRARGGLGTHWKMPSRVAFKIPSTDKDEPDVKRELTGEQTICLIQALFAKDIKKRSAPMIDSGIGKHVQCNMEGLPQEVRSAFLDDHEGLQKAWRRLQTSLQK